MLKSVGWNTKLRDEKMSSYTTKCAEPGKGMNCAPDREA
jgi:hypothetical protein